MAYDEMNAAIQGISDRLDTLASIKTDTILLPGGPQERYHQIVEEAYVVLGLIETLVDELRSELEHQHKRLDEARDAALSEMQKQQNAAQEWYTRARVRIKETVTKRARESWEHTFRAGTELEMVQWGRAGRKVDRSAWWTSFDIDEASIIEADKVEVIQILEEVPPD